MAFDPSSRSLLAPCDLPRFAEQTLFHRIARAICAADCLPRKELYESWEVARRVRRRFRGGRVVDLCAGHGLTAWIMLLLDDSSASALAVDTRIAPSAVRLGAALQASFPKLAGRVTVQQDDLSSITLDAKDVVVATHACGILSDRVIARAMSVGARLAVLPCCHDAKVSDTGGLLGWLDPALAIDVTRAARLRQAGYVVHTQAIPAHITPKNRLLLASPAQRG